MTAEQIRAQKFECDDGHYESARWLQEIAAQLAELNTNLKDATAKAEKLQLDFLRGDVR